jgi:PPOX class probable F420-dependent enzyme
MQTEQQVYASGQGAPAWADEVLHRRAYAVLATRNPDGSPQMAPLMYVYDGDRFLFSSRSTTRKVRNLRSRPWARVLVQGGIDHERWIAATGPTEIVDGAASHALNRQVGERYLTESGRVGWERTIGLMEDATIVLAPERWTWWDVAGMFEVIVEQGYTGEEAAAWFHPLDP